MLMFIDLLVKLADALHVKLDPGEKVSESLLRVAFKRLSSIARLRKRTP
jgi:hypothetical protein